MEHSSRERHRGVTWVELLIVIAICIFLFCVLFPVFQRPHEIVSQPSCSSNMKQVGLGLLQYAQDNNNKLPNGTQTTPGLGWVGQVYPYVKSTRVFHCPDDTTESKTPSANVLSYAYNSNIPTWSNTQPPMANGFPNPAQLVVCFEVARAQFQLPPSESVNMNVDEPQGATMFSATGDGTANGLHSTMRGPDHIHYATGDLGGRPDGMPNQFDEARHQGGSEFLLADGHVKWFKSGQVSTGTDAPTPTAAQTGTLSGTAAGTANANYTATFSVK